MRIRLTLLIALFVALFGAVLPVEGQANYDTYNGDRLYTNFDPVDDFGCTTYWYPGLFSNPPAWAVTHSGLGTGGCAANGTAEVIGINWKTKGPIWIDYINVWGHSISTYALIMHAPGANLTLNTSGFSSDAYGTIGVNQWIPSGDIIIEKLSVGYGGVYPDPANMSSIVQVEIHWRASAPTATPTPSPRPSSTPAPSSTAYDPTGSPAPTTRPTAGNTIVAPAITPQATIDTCGDDITQPCSTYQFPTLSVPTFWLPSPTAIALLPTNTPAPITFTPSATRTATQIPTNTNTPGPSPTAAPPTAIVPTLDVTQWYDGGNALMAAVPTLLPLIGAGFDVGGSQTPVGIVDAAERFGTGAAQVLRLARGLELTDINRFGGIVSFGLLLFLFGILVEVLVLIIPLVLKLLGWLWKLIKLIPIIE